MHAYSIRRFILVLLAAVTACGVIGIPNGHAASVVLSGLHLASTPGANQSATTKFPAGISTIYFDYKVDAPFPNDKGQVKVIPGGVTGTPIASTDLELGLQTPQYVSLKRSGGANFADGGYCAVLYLDGVQDPGDGHMPIAFTIGNATAPSCPKPASGTPKPTGTTTPGGTSHPQLTLTSNIKVLSVGKATTIRIQVRAGNQAVAGVNVRLDPRKVGINHYLKFITGAQGIATFHNVKATRAGTLSVAAFKHAYKKASLTLTAH